MIGATRGSVDLATAFLLIWMAMCVMTLVMTGVLWALFVGGILP